MAPSKWEAVDEAELQAQGNNFEVLNIIFYFIRYTLIVAFIGFIGFMWVF